MKFSRGLLLWLCLHLCLAAAHSQFSYLNKNGQKVVTPDVPLSDVRLYGATNGQFISVDTNGKLVGVAAPTGGGGLNAITGYIQAGTNATLSGAGTSTSPYVVNGPLNIVPAFPSSSFRVLGFGDSVCAGIYDSPSSLNYFNVWAATFLPTGTATNNCVSGSSVQNLATQVYAQTFGPTDYSFIGSFSNDSPSTPGSGSNYFYGYESLAVFASVPDGTGTGGWASKVLGKNLGCTGGSTTDQYAIGTKMASAGATCTWTFSGDVFYLGTSSNNTSGQKFNLSFDGGANILYGPFGAGGTGQGPWIITYSDHLGALNYDNFLVRVPLAQGRSAFHTVTFTCVTAPCYVDYVASNGFTSGPRVIVPLAWVNGVGSAQSATSAAQFFNVQLNFMCDQLSRDGLAVGCADLSGYVNYFLNSSGWANTLHPNNAGSAAQAQGLGFRSQQGIVPSNAIRPIRQWTLHLENCNGFNACEYANPIIIPHPSKLENITMTLNTTTSLGSCTGGTYTPPYLQISNGSYGNETYSFPAANLGPNNNFSNLYFDTLTGWNQTIYASIVGGSCSSGSNVGGNFSIDAVISYSDQ